MISVPRGIENWKYWTTELLNGTIGQQLFVAIFLSALTVGSMLNIYFYYIIFRPSVPAKLILSYGTMIYDSGIPPLRLAFSFARMDGSNKPIGIFSFAPLEKIRKGIAIYRKMFQKRIKTEFDRSQLKTLRLRGYSLFINQGSKRYELATEASEPEREWLFKILNEHYNS